ncbi:MAG TPA: hypothetical protein DCS93_13940 [Microscillaceae bacterium]|nr:hypothetical protein [Microscillaceae bacterium]
MQNYGGSLKQNRCSFLILHRIRCKSVMSKNYKYEEIVLNIEEKIHQEILVTGQKLPSVRALCLELSVSPSTVFKAYYELEARGLIEVRNKSGYYVSLKATQLQKIKHKVQAVFDEGDLKKANNVDEMIEEIEQAKLNDLKVDFSSATPSVEMLPLEKLNKSIRSSLASNPQDLIAYENPLGAVQLRKYISLQKIKGNLSNLVDQIVITAGCLEAIGISLKILLKSGDAVLVDTLNYYNIVSLLKSTDVKIYTYPFSESSDFDARHFEEVLHAHQIKLCLISPNFHNPTGTSLSTEVKETIVKVATRHQVYIIEDDVYGDLYFGKNKPSTLKQFDTQGLVYYCSSFSKTLAPGFRIGYCLPGNQYQEFAKYKRLLSLGTNSVTQAALVNFMTTGRYDFHLKRLRKQLHLNMLKYGDTILQVFPAHIHLQVPEGGYVFWIGFPPPFDGYELYKKCLQKNILITPGEVFSATGAYKNFIRISFSKPFDRLVEDALKTIGNLASDCSIAHR